MELQNVNQIWVLIISKKKNIIQFYVTNKLRT